MHQSTILLIVVIVIIIIVVIAVANCRSKNCGSSEKVHNARRKAKTQKRINYNVPPVTYRKRSKVNTRNPVTEPRKEVNGNLPFSIDEIINAVDGESYDTIKDSLNRVFGQSDRKNPKNYRKINRNKVNAKGGGGGPPGDGTTYDYIVVGAGAAGCAMARKLSDDFKYSVLLLEAGDDQSDDVPIRDTGDPRVNLSEFYPHYHWQGQTIQQNHRRAITGASSITDRWTCGRLLGGGSSINGYQAVFGTASRWDEIDYDLGGSGRWSADEIFRRYKDIEDFTAYGFTPSSNRGSGGDWSVVTRPVYVTSDETFIANMVNNGYGNLGKNIPIVNDYNDPDESEVSVFTRWQLTQDPSQDYDRESSDTAFLHEGIINENGNGVNGRQLKLIVNATVVSLFFPDGNNVCKGVRYLNGGKTYLANAKKQVILCLGLRDSQFLQTQGIGPASVLSSAGIEPRVCNENVGRHLINHPVLVTVFYAPGISGASDPMEPSGGGIYSAGAFLPYADVADGPVDQRAYQMIFIKAPSLLIALPLGMRPSSEGTIRVLNDDPLRMPLVDTNYYNDPEFSSSTTSSNSLDLRAMKEIVREFASVVAAEVPGSFPIVPSASVLADDDDLEAFILADSSQPHHWQNTCRMGVDSSDGVVDETGKVFGIEGLSIASSSILPPIDGNLASPSIVAAITVAEALIEER